MFTTKYMGPLDLSTAAALQHYENAAFLGPPVRRPAPAHLRDLYYEGGQKLEPVGPQPALCDHMAACVTTLHPLTAPCAW